jgi:intracellular sulfur oxidation DsrE/DsrF family protein
MLSRAFFVFAVLAVAAVGASAQKWPEANAPAFPQADPYVAIPGAAMSPGAASEYWGVFDATKFPSDRKAILPALNAVGGLLNDLAVGATPEKNAHFVVVFHGAATDGILTNAAYRQMYGTDNPNLAVIEKMKRMGVELYVCGQFLAASKIDPATITKDVTVAVDAYLVLLEYQHKGYGVMSF